MRTTAEEILYAVKGLRTRELEELSAKDIKQHMELSNQVWQNIYSKAFNAMRVGSPTCNKVGQKYRNVFERVCHGSYYLTAYGEQVIDKLEINPHSSTLAPVE